MSVNEGTIDRVIRAVAGIVLLVLGILLLQGAGQIVAVVIGAVLMVTALIGFCPAYRIFGINTCATKPPENKKA